MMLLPQKYKLACIATVTMLVTGCLSSSKKLLEENDAPKMSEVFHGVVTAPLNAQTEHKERLHQRSIVDHSEHFRNESNETHNLFKRLPNPDLVIYVFAHFTDSSEHVPIPGYSTVVPMYGKVHYAQAGDKTADY